MFTAKTTVHWTRWREDHLLWRWKRYILNSVDEVRLPTQDEPLLSGGVVGGSDAQERLGGSHAPELGTPQVGGPVAPISACSSPCGPL